MGKVNSVNRSFMSVRQLSTAGLLVGITIFLGISGYGFIPLFAVNAYSNDYWRYGGRA